MAITLPALTLAGAGAYTSSEESVVSLPMLTIAGVGDPQMALPALALAGQGYTGRVGEGAVELPMLTVAGGSAGVELPMLTIVGAGSVLQPPGEGAFDLPMLTVSGAGYQNSIGAGAFTLPMLQIVGAGVTAAPAVDATAGAPGSGTGLEFSAGDALVMNLRNSAASTYTNYGFNSFAWFNGVALGANADGIHAIASGALDGADAIDCYVRPRIDDFGVAYQKQMPRAYVGYRTNGRVRIKVKVDESGWYVYELNDRAVTTLHRTRAKIGKGLKGNYWQVEIANFEGSSLELDVIELAPSVVMRKVA